MACLKTFTDKVNDSGDISWQCRRAPYSNSDITYVVVRATAMAVCVGVFRAISIRALVRWQAQCDGVLRLLYRGHAWLDVWQVFTGLFFIYINNHSLLQGNSQVHVLMTFADGFHRAPGCCMFSFTKYCFIVWVWCVLGNEKSPCARPCSYTLPWFNTLRLLWWRTNQFVHRKNTSTNYFMFVKYSCHLLVGWKQWIA